MAKTPQTSPASPVANLDTQSPTTAVSGVKPFDPTRSREEGKVYDEAMAANREREFVDAIMEARRPPPVPVHNPPKPGAATIKQTELEMAAGAKRVAEYAAEEDVRKAAHEAHKRDKWADKKSVEVFRPADYVPDQKKGQGNVTVTGTPV